MTRTILDYLEILICLLAFLLGIAILILSCASTALLDAISRPFMKPPTYRSRLYSEYSWDGE
ncbi:MAG TPA: hypothetical protein EYF98_07075 [Planctomycetes bacterium]|nr:hypothetical protein [Planctomycetota bacterium]